MKSWLQDNSIEIYLMQNGGGSVVAEIFITPLKSKSYEYMTAILKNTHTANYAI